MKKYNLIKVIAITVLVGWILTLIIPGSSFDYSGNISTTSIQASGLWGLFSNLGISISYFNGIAIFIIAVACFYSVLGKLEVYNNFVSKVADKFSAKTFVIISTLFFGIVSLFVSDFTALIVFIPFFYSVMKKIGVDNKVILSSTIVSGIIGSMCGIYNSGLFKLLNLDINTLLLVKVIVFVISMLVLLIFTAPKNNSKVSLVKTEGKKEDASETKKEEVIVKTSSKKKEVKKTNAKNQSKTKTNSKTAKARKGA